MEQVEQISLFNVIRELNDIEFIKRSIYQLSEGETIRTSSCEVEYMGRFITVKTKEFEEPFTSIKAALDCIERFLANGIEAI
ncbi:hypothetical protein ACIQ4I_05625 [Rummeliibacillus sp. NPDC094406]|uniref:hypothetical protein n=1 Tax=Rummeliibacillus sp. NPDC094406 TaxID=3364511 RepID=UPI00382FFD58